MPRQLLLGSSFGLVPESLRRKPAWLEPLQGHQQSGECCILKMTFRYFEYRAYFFCIFCILHAIKGNNIKICILLAYFAYVLDMAHCLPYGRTKVTKHTFQSFNNTVFAEL